MTAAIDIVEKKITIDGVGFFVGAIDFATQKISKTGGDGSIESEDIKKYSMLVTHFPINLSKQLLTAKKTCSGREKVKDLKTRFKNLKDSSIQSPHRLVIKEDNSGQDSSKDSLTP